MNDAPARLREPIILIALGVLILAITSLSLTGVINWVVVGRWLRDWVVVLVLVTASISLIGVGLFRARKVRSDPTQIAVLRWWVILVGLAVVAGVGWGATSWLLGEAANAKDPAAARVEAIKTGLGVSAGTGGLFALLLAVRRQWHQELSTADTVADATERRITELYTKASDQLGSDKAPVRLAGLHALERVAQNNPSQRQTITDVICAYLRMPYETPGRRPAPGVYDETLTRYENQTQEALVRRAAQYILHRHIHRYGKSSIISDFWPGLEITLVGAHLSNANFTGARLTNADLTGVNFAGANLAEANLVAAVVTDADLRRADLAEANLYGANLSRSTLTGAILVAADLRAADLISADLQSADFGGANLTDANFANADLRGADFTTADLTNASFFEANLTGARFTQAKVTEAQLALARHPVEEPSDKVDSSTSDATAAN